MDWQPRYDLFGNCSIYMNPGTPQDGPQPPELQDLGDRHRGLQASRDWLAKALALTPRDVGARMALGLALQDLGDHEGARSQFELADQSKPDNIRILVNLAASCLRCGRVADFEATLAGAERARQTTRNSSGSLARHDPPDGSVIDASVRL